MSYFEEDYVRKNMAAMQNKIVSRGTNALLKDFDAGSLSEADVQHMLEIVGGMCCGDKNSVASYMDKICSSMAAHNSDCLEELMEIRLGYAQAAQEENDQTVLVSGSFLSDFKKALTREGMRMMNIKPVLGGIDREDPVAAFRLYQLIFGEMETSPTLLLTKKHWISALKYIVTLYFLAEDIEDIEVPEDHDELKDIYIQTFVTAVILANTESSVKKQIKSDAKIEERQPSKTLQNENAALKKQNESLKNENKELQLRLRKDITNAVVPLEKQLSQKNAEIDRLQEELTAYKSIRQAEEEVDEVLECVDELMELPEDGVAFVGGHYNLQSKLKLRYPSWKFYTTDTPAANIGRPDIVFLYSDHINHILFNRVSTKYRDRMLYCHGTNIEKLSENMQRVYTAYQLKAEKI